MTSEVPDARAGDDRFGPALAARTARQAVAAWARAVDGDDAALTAIATPEAAHWLMHPARKGWRVAPGPRVTAIEIWQLDAAADQPRLRVKFEFAGRSLIDGQEQAAAAGQETDFVGMLDLTLDGTGRHQWRISSGHVDTLDDFLGYVFTTRTETGTEYRERTRTPGRRAAAAGPRVFSVRASFADHDVRFSSAAAIEVQGESAPTREEAVRLVWPAIESEITRALGSGDWRPSLSSLEVVELLRDPPAG